MDPLALGEGGDGIQIFGCGIGTPAFHPGSEILDGFRSGIFIGIVVPAFLGLVVV